MLPMYNVWNQIKCKRHSIWLIFQIEKLIDIYRLQLYMDEYDANLINNYHKKYTFVTNMKYVATSKESLVY